MMTADFMHTPAGNNPGVFAEHIFNERLPDPHGTRYFGIAGGCLDAPETMPAGSTYWYPYAGSGWDMPRSFRRPK